MRAIFVLLALLAGSAAAQQPRFPIDLQQGVLAGEAAETSVILQARLTSTSPYVDPYWSGVVGARGVARFAISASDDFADARTTGWLAARPETDFIVKTVVRGLDRGQRYYYRLEYGPDEANTRLSETAAFRTLAGADEDQRFRFAVVTGMNYSKFHHTGYGEDPTASPSAQPYDGSDKDLGYPGLAAILAAGADYFVPTGDNVYYDTPRVGRAETLHQMRRKHQEQYSQPRFRELFRNVGTYWLKDDHDHRFDDSDPYNLFIAWPGLLVDEPKPRDYYPREVRHPLVSGAGHLPTHEMGVHVFREQLPVVDPHDPEAVTYRTHRVARSLQVWIVEGRDYRSPNDMPDGPAKTIWGEAQKAWLKRTLLESDAAFKVLISATPMVGPDQLGKRDNHTDPGGFLHEGKEFFDFLVENEIQNFYTVCGDRHWKYHAIHPTGYEEFSSGALDDTNAIPGARPGPNSTDPEGLIKHPYHNEEATGGYLLFTLVPGDPPTLEFEFQDENGERLYHVIKRP